MAHYSARRVLKAVPFGLTVLAVLFAGAIATGRAAFVVTAGDSMNPLYYQGDLVVVAKADSYAVGEIVAYRLPDKDFVVLHRIVGQEADGFVFKGDNNQSIDPTHPTTDQLVGRAVLHLPQVGRWFRIFTSPFALAVAAFALTTLGGTVIRTRRRKKRATMAQSAPRSTPLTRSVLALPHQLRIVLGVTGVIALAGVALGAVAWAAPTTVLADTSTQSVRQMSFSYTAEVPLSAAYDGTTVTSPDPVFRRLTDAVAVHLDYQGGPGSMSVDAELSTPGGWHATVPLAGPADFTGDRYESTVDLDLAAFDARAQSAAAVTGLPAGPLTVAVVATVRGADGTDFTPTLGLSLTPLALTLAGGPTEPTGPASTGQTSTGQDSTGQDSTGQDSTVQDSTTVHDSAPVPNALGAMGLSVTVVQARVLSAVLLVAAVVASVAVIVTAQRRPPVGEGTRIRRRYAPQLAAIEPMTTPPSVPVIEVTEFGTLAKLAERCGQLVLHWSRSDVETFVVLDEGTTYRYRTGSSGVRSDDPALTQSTDSDHQDYAEFDSR